MISLEESIEHQLVEASETNQGDETSPSEAIEAVEAAEAIEPAEPSEPTLADVAKDLREVSETLKPYVATTEAGNLSVPGTGNEANEGQSASLESDENDFVDLLENTTED